MSSRPASVVNASFGAAGWGRRRWRLRGGLRCRRSGRTARPAQPRSAGRTISGHQGTTHSHSSFRTVARITLPSRAERPTTTNAKATLYRTRRARPTRGVDDRTDAHTKTCMISFATSIPSRVSRMRAPSRRSNARLDERLQRRRRTGPDVDAVTRAHRVDVDASRSAAGR